MVHGLRCCCQAVLGPPVANPRTPGRRQTTAVKPPLEAIGILADFYKGAAKGAVSLLQVSPVDEAAGSQGTADGAYQGNQAASGGIMGMMNVIKSDFERTIETTKNSEYEAEYASVLCVRLASLGRGRAS